MKGYLVLLIILMSSSRITLGQSITAAEIEIISTDSIMVQGPLKVNGSITVEGSASNAEGRLFFNSDKPRILFKETDVLDENYRMMVSGGDFLLDVTGDDFASTGRGMTMKSTGQTTFNGGLKVTNGFLTLGDEESRTLNEFGQISVASSRVVLDTYQGAASDELVSINWAGADPVDGALLFLRTVSAQRDILIKHNGSGGNIKSSTYSDEYLTTRNEIAMLMYVAATGSWQLISAR